MISSHTGHDTPPMYWTFPIALIYPSNVLMIQGCHFPWLSLLFQTKIKSLRPFRGVWGHAPHKIFKIRIFNLTEMNFRQQNSLTFGILSQIPWLFQVFQVSGNPDISSMY